MSSAAALNTTAGNSARCDADLPERRPLYIVARDHVQVRSNGEFLIVQQNGHPARHFAVSNLDRIVCNHNVDWTGEALSLCLRHRLTISWVTGRSELLGHCAPTVPDTGAMHACIEKFALLSSAETRWDNWFRHRRMHVLSTWAERHDKTGEPVSERMFREQKRSFVYWRRPPLNLDPELIGPFQSIVIARLTHEGVQCSYPGRSGTVLNLLDELTLLLWGEVNLGAGGLGVRIADRRVQWQFLESWQKEHAALLEEHLETFKLFLVRTLNTCP